jgi:hypothetical protein
MNERLQPVFELIVPAIEQAGISYWIYGGVAIAGIKGEFIRQNRDVDLFVLDEDYESTRNIIQSIAENLGWRFIDTNYKNRPKREWFEPDDDKDLLSLMPVFKLDARVRIIFQTSINDFPVSVLDRHKRRVGPWVFTTPDNTYLKELFLRNLKYIIKVGKFASKQELRDKYKKDATVILSDEERNTFWGPYT